LKEDDDDDDDDDEVSNPIIKFNLGCRPACWAGA
jgi:hypothetical protein